MSRAFRLILLAYMGWLLGCFLPGHVRGQITMGPKQAADSSSCCASHAPTDPQRQPTERDKRNCAVCHFAAGLQLLTPHVLDLSPVAQARPASVIAVGRLNSHDCPREALPRGPPVFPA